MALRILSLALLLLACAAPAQELRNLPPSPQDFAWQWPLTVAPHEDLVQVELTAEVYARLWRDDTADLVVFNGHGEAVPTAPLDAVLARADLARAAPAAPIDVPMFGIPASGARSANDRLRLVVTQRSDGHLERLEAEVESQTAPEPGTELLLDLSIIPGRTRGLTVEFSPGTEGLVARVDVFGSRDLSNWTRLATGQALVALNDRGLRLERLRIEFADTTLPYLRLVRTDARQPLPIAAVQALRGRAPDPARQSSASIELAGRTEPRLAGILYQTDGPLPVERVLVNLAERNAAASVIIESRPRSDLPWRERARGAVFHLSGRDGAVESTPFDIEPVRDRQWRVRTDPAQVKPPTLTLFWRPDRFVFLTQGEGPYRLAAGSARSQRGSFPLNAVLVEARKTRGADWMPTQARLGRGAELGGGAALAPRPDASGSPTPWQWLLWALLLLGAFSVVTMVLKLLRQSGA